MNESLGQKLTGVGVGYDYIDMEVYRSYILSEEPRFKTDALIFDQIAIPGLRYFFETFDYSFENQIRQKLLDEEAAIFLKNFYSEVEFLYNKEFFVDPYGHMTLEEWRTFRPRGKYYFDIMTGESGFQYVDRMPFIDSEVDLNVIKTAVNLFDSSDKVQAIRLFSNNPGVTQDPFIRLGAENVLKIVIDAVPSPDAMTPWEDIFGFREDSQAKGQLLKLRKWARKVAASATSTSEIYEEFYDLLNDYETYMNLHVKKIIKGPLETFITVAGDALEDLLKLRFGSLAKKPFTLSHQKLELTEAELKAPGREMAYLHLIRQKFHS